MSWWFWILLWVALVAVALLFFAVLGVKLFRSFTALLRELEEAGDRLGRPGEIEPLLAAEAGIGGNHPPGSGIFLAPRQMKVQYKASKLQRQELRRQRRMERKHQRGQPQALRDLR